MSKCGTALSGIKSSRLEQEMVLLRHEMATIKCDQLDLNTKRMQSCESLEAHDNIRKLTKRLQNRDMYIAYLEEQIRKTRSKYELKVRDVKVGADLLEQELKKVRNELQVIATKAKGIDQLQHRAEILRNKLKRRNAIIAQYETQHTEIMGIINQLHMSHKMKKNRSHLKTVGTQTLSRVPKVQESATDDKSSTDEIFISKLTDYVEIEKPVEKFACLTTALRRKFELNPEV